jgi:SAM-dependent methyltransferase
MLEPASWDKIDSRPQGQHDMSTPEATREAASINEVYYNRPTDGLADYRQLMAGPLWRTRLLLEQIASPPPRRVADLGCGGGDLLRAVHARHPGAETVGFDFSSAQIEANQSRQPGVTWRIADLNHVAAFPADLLGRFDTLISLEVIEHLDHPASLLRNALQLAAPGARLILSTQSGRVGETERRVGHLRHFSVADMTELLDSAGWRPVRVWNTGFPFHDWSKRLANLNPDASMRMFSEQRYGPLQRAVCALLRLAFRFNSAHHGNQLFAVAVLD